MTDGEKTGNEFIDEIGEEPTLDSFFDRNPRTLTDDHLRQLIEIERRNRATFIEKRNK